MNKTSASGFTLLEIMLVVVLIAGMAMLAVGTRPGNDDSEKLALSLAKSLDSRAEQAMLDGQLYGAFLYSNGMDIYQLSLQPNQGVQSQAWPGYRWQKVPLARRNRPFRLPEGWSLDLVIEGQPVPLAPYPQHPARDPVLVFFPGGESSDFQIALNHNGATRYLVMPVDGYIVHRSGRQP